MPLDVLDSAPALGGSHERARPGRVQVADEAELAERGRRDQRPHARSAAGLLSQGSLGG